MYHAPHDPATLEGEIILRRKWPHLRPARDQIDPLRTPEPLPFGFSRQLFATLLADPIGWGRLLIRCGNAARRAGR